jgi:ribose transport system ATP-binding protein
MNAVLNLEHLTKTFFGVPAVRDVSLTVEPGHILGLIGQNGAGKSTLMNLIGGVVQPDSGRMVYQGKPYRPRRPADAYNSGIAFIHQELNLFTNLTIAENIFIEHFPTRRLGPLRLVDRAAVQARTHEVLAEVGLDLSPHLTIDRISPGERQLVEIAKALHQDAPLIILDEPTTSLTNRETERLFDLMRRLREQGKTMIYISHILRDVLELADSVAIMRDGQLVTHEPASALMSTA